MAEPLDVRRALLDPEQLALAAVFVVAGIDWGTLDRDWIQHLHAIDDLDLVSVGICQAHTLPAAGFVDVFDRRGAGDPRDFLEVLQVRRMDGDADVAGLAKFGDMDVVRGIGAAHVKGVPRPVGADHAEISEELLLLVEIGRAQAPISEVEGFDRRHEILPKGTIGGV